MKFKIVSNPYTQNIDYYWYKDKDKQWIAVNQEDDGESQLITDELVKGFFPFKVKKIVDSILEEYGSDEVLELEFEGPEDELDELKSVLHNEEYKGKIHLKNMTAALANAREIRPEISDIFQEVERIATSFKNSRETREIKNKFNDVNNDSIPVCVVGNYSSGKSTFINALIGAEILPSGDEPLTAKIYKISQAGDQSGKMSFLKFQYKGQETVINITGHGVTFLSGGNDFAQDLIQSLQQLENPKAQDYIREAIAFINNPPEQYDLNDFSEIIEIITPFGKGLLGKAAENFVIFDTPGSNSASNTRHLEVLRTALSTMSNGLPVLVCDTHSLDSTDNESLVKEVLEIEALEPRFTMIVVNKADEMSWSSISHPEKNRKTVMNQSTPRSLFAQGCQGIFYVSSIMGLGSKLDGGFYQEDYIFPYQNKLSYYQDLNSRYDTHLDSLNIIPEHIRQKELEERAQIENPVFTNSGLFSIERQMALFAHKYSSYNKCQQALRFLEQFIRHAGGEIEHLHQQKNRHQIELEDSLEKGQAELLEKINERITKSNERFQDRYQNDLDELVDTHLPQIDYHQLSLVRDRALEDYEKQNQLKPEAEIIEPAVESENLKSWAGIQNRFSGAIEGWQAQKQMKQAASDYAAERVIAYTIETYGEQCLKLKQEMFDCSCRKYLKHCRKLKEALIRLITDSDSISEQEKEKLGITIRDFSEMSFTTHPEKFFIKSKLEIAFKFREFTLKDQNFIYMGKLVKLFNEQMRREIYAQEKIIEEIHLEKYQAWLDNLKAELVGSMTSSNPRLRDLTEQIHLNLDELNTCSDKLNELKNLETQLQNLMSWKERAAGWEFEN